jgi:hypothetical protein
VIEQIVFIHNPRHPLRRIKEQLCEIKVCKKYTWAIEADGQRRLLGTSAFFSRPSAVTMKLARLLRLKDAKFYDKHDLKFLANLQLKRYYETGEIK